MAYAQRCEPRPIRVYMTFDEFESIVFSGSNYEAGLAAIRFPTVAGYDFRWQYYPGKGHTWGNNDYETQLNALGFIWKDWASQPVGVLEYSKDLSAVVDKGSAWQAVTDKTPLPSRVAASVDGGTYEARGGEIWLAPKSGKRRKVADGFLDISALTLSSDLRDGPTVNRPTSPTSAVRSTVARCPSSAGRSRCCRSARCRAPC